MGMLQCAVLVFGVLLQLCNGQNICKKTSTSGGSTTTTFTKCADKCCGDVNDEYCCETSDSGLVIAVVATSVVFIILALGLAICCMKNHTKQTSRVAVLHMTATQNATARRDERRERRQREAAVAMAGYPQQYMPGYAGVPPPTYNSMYGENLPPGAFAEYIPPPGPHFPSTSQDEAGAMGGMDAYQTKH
ncbi:uncharacterized protein LOC110447313 [Mizuhopecten yessoensis]|uniref:Uncharacterized protein n=1 Tax=Mizuhopecten yessoensis TaxID=6573 RepID=A0A210QVJ4_MIZYE|nr:uncharacterized protein LOC110447313 [Mizuhopecten yessoensis]OWF52779.1 hypothetical protein KP79_PYT17565 [Mizuhopecten yessoensis]